MLAWRFGKKAGGHKVGTNADRVSSQLSANAGEQAQHPLGLVYQGIPPGLVLGLSLTYLITCSKGLLHFSTSIERYLMLY